MTEQEDLRRLAAHAPGTLDLFRLDGRAARVVGGTRGLGQAMALGLAVAGADVCVASRGPGGLRETAEAITGLGRHGTCYAADVTDEAQVERMVALC
jgi:NAD(P)-dependent dehydrogenase (short-subunit alcohol dehydrogenase family)